MEYKKLDFIIGKVFETVKKSNGEESVFFGLKDESGILGYTMYHNQDCCEDVLIEGIIGDLDDLVNTPILKAEVRTSTDETPVDPEAYSDESNTWTFFEFVTIKGSVTIRWWGSSNGYYGEDVDICEVNENGTTGKTVHMGYDWLT